MLSRRVREAVDEKARKTVIGLVEVRTIYVIYKQQFLQS
jgi:hypothetical protein